VGNLTKRMASYLAAKVVDPNKPGGIKKGGSAMGTIVDAARGGLVAYGTVYNGLEANAKVLGNNLKQNSVKVVQLGESPGVRTTQVYWPARVAGKLLLFRLQLWDAGDAAVRKYGHVYPVCREGASGVLLVFSYTDRASWEELPGLIQRTVMQDPGVLPVIVGNKFGNPADNEVSQSEVSEAEASWSIPIVRIRHQSQNPAPGALPEVAAALNTICEQLYLAKHRHKLTVEPALI